MYFRTSCCLNLLFLLATVVSYGQQTEKKGAITETLGAFHQAIIDNDSQSARTLLSDSALVLEGGNVETKDEYLSHHFHSDGKFLRTMNRKIESRTVSVEGNTAWVSTQTHIWGTFSERTLDLNSLELAVLKKIDGSWKITALHWSSTNRN